MRGRSAGWKEARENWLRARRAERQYAVRLRHIARQIDVIVSGLFHPENPADPGWAAIEQALRQYELLLEPWAEATAARMLADVALRDAASWQRLGKVIGRALRQEIDTAPIGPLIQELQALQVHLITSLPRDAAERVHELSLEAVTSARRWEEIARDILAQGKISRSKANTIARTETARAATNVEAVRAQHVGSEGFVWRTARDKDVRKLHRQFEGHFYRWDDPPILDDGRPGLPGTIYNCRCFAEIVLPGEIPVEGPRPRNPAYLEALRQQGYSTGTAFE